MLSCSTSITTGKVASSPGLGRGHPASAIAPITNHLVVGVSVSFPPRHSTRALTPGTHLCQPRYERQFARAMTGRAVIMANNDIFRIVSHPVLPNIRAVSCGLYQLLQVSHASPPFSPLFRPHLGPNTLGNRIAASPGPHGHFCLPRLTAAPIGALTTPRLLRLTLGLKQVASDKGLASSVPPVSAPGLFVPGVPRVQVANEVSPISVYSSATGCTSQPRW